MNREEINAKASYFGIDYSAMNKAETIRAIQHAEGYTPSFGSNDGTCPYVECCFWVDCIKEYSAHNRAAKKDATIKKSTPNIEPKKTAKNSPSRIKHVKN